jgi:hypothetical protein
LLRAAAGCALTAVACVGVANVYALFGHGVRSAAMDYMFLVPLICGGGLFALCSWLAPGMPCRRFWRLGFNLYNSALAAAVTGLFFAGVLEIAGTSPLHSPFTYLFAVLAVVLLAAAIVCWAFPARVRG